MAGAPPAAHRAAPLLLPFMAAAPGWRREGGKEEMREREREGVGEGCIRIGPDIILCVHT